MTKKIPKEITSLPLDATVRRRVLRFRRALDSVLQRFFSSIDDWFRSRLVDTDRRLALPEGTLVSQHEHDYYPEGPWEVVSWTGDDYKLAHAEGKPIFTPSGNRENHIYVYSRFVRPLRDQALAPAPSSRLQSASPLN